ncbi:MAG: GNAT family N-acetyltransferase [Gemmatimonadetes bacterium]|jgi:GNAT superfamily N-acetyltransferase|nr:GNAT family N-acetyltransferase [Gemmatimonadota bacterium]MBT5141413.1 GNAT family N-acetyltransferase [Gemmatimonadota bacterium]MBT5590793.1 GNAT family N-acetyltransferase [Gemmatimonadota bacterium]MBT5964331.1 GNAT family N-acetyltransferase [Gemmatimonadota bacterium]MBT7598964.1 GNAT family N-acetyltransferase [Gemmatimonadota bacterium]
MTSISGKSTVDNTLDLLNARLQTVFVLNEAGDLVSTREPYPPARRPAPTVYLAWAAEGYLCRFGTGTSAEIRTQISKVVEREWPFPTTAAPPCTASVLDILGPSKWSSGPVFVVPELPTETDAVRVRLANTGVLQEELAGWADHVDVEQPICASLVDGMAVSVCGSVRRSDIGVEAGVDTLEAYRRQGHGKRAVKAWGAAAREDGLLAFYSTWWANEPSIRLANSLGLKQIGATFGVS